MKKVGLMFLMLAIGVAVGVRISGSLSPVEGQAKPGIGFAAVPGLFGLEVVTRHKNVLSWPRIV
jgi:hypothetical protein